MSAAIANTRAKYIPKRRANDIIYLVLLYANINSARLAAVAAKGKARRSLLVGESAAALRGEGAKSRSPSRPLLRRCTKRGARSLPKPGSAAAECRLPARRTSERLTAAARTEGLPAPACKRGTAAGARKRASTAELRGLTEARRLAERRRAAAKRGGLAECRRAATER